MRQALFALTRLLVLSAIVFGADAGAAAAAATATAGDAVKGAAIFVKECALCHSIGKGEPNRFGPNLFGVVERRAGTASGYQYSPEFSAAANWIWNPDTIASFVAAPGVMVPGNKMSVFQGVADSQINDLIAFVAAQK
jgi:cytochrome c